MCGSRARDKGMGEDGLGLVIYGVKVLPSSNKTV